MAWTTRTFYTGTGSQSLYTFPWGYIASGDVKVAVDGSPITAFTVGANSITLDAALASGAKLAIYRQTDRTVFGTLSYGTTPSTAEINSILKRVQYLAQEAADVSNEGVISELSEGIYDAQSGLIRNLAAGTGATDAVNKAQLDAAVASGQPLDATLTALAGLATGADTLPYFTGTDTASQTTLTSFARTLLDDTNQAGMRTTLGLTPGTDVQTQDAELSALAGLTSAADQAPYFTGSGTAALTTVTSFARTLLDDTNQAGMRTTLGLTPGTDVQAQDAELAALAGLTSAADQAPYFTGSGTAALATVTSFARTLLDDANQAAMRTTLGLVPGTDVQAQDAELAALAGLTSAADALPYFTGPGTAAVTTVSSFIRTLLDDADAATARSTLGVGAGTGDVTTSGATTQYYIPAWDSVSKRLVPGIAPGTATHVLTSNGGAANPSMQALPTASSTAAGIVELAVDAEAQALADTSRAITAANLASLRASQAEAEAGTATDRFLTPQRGQQAISALQSVAYLNRVTVSGAAVIKISSIPSNAQMLEGFYSGTVATDAVNIRTRVGVATVTQSGASDYAWNTHGADMTTGSPSRRLGDNADTFIQVNNVANALGNAAGERCDFRWSLHEPGDTTHAKLFTADGVFSDTAGTRVAFNAQGSYYGSNSALTDLEISASSGNVTAVMGAWSRRAF